MKHLLKNITLLIVMRFQISNRFPDYLLREKLHVLTTRNTLYGIHQPLYQPNYDQICTKTQIVSFIRHEDAASFKYTLESYQRNNKTFPDRVMDGSSADFREPGSYIPLVIDTIDAEQLQKLCDIHYFTLLIVHKIHDSDEPYQDMYQCYLYDSPMPSKDVSLAFIRDMYKM